MSLAIGRTLARTRRFGLKIRRNEDGATAVEFAIVALPFFLLLFGVMSVCHLFFWIFTSENAVWTASRDMRTGAFQTVASGGTVTGSPYNGKTGDALKTEFRNQICLKTVNPVDCNNNSIVLVQSTAGFSTIADPNCKTNTNALVSDTAAMAAFDAGSSSSTVLVTLCYAWGFGGKLPFFKIGTLSNGAFLIQASAAFRTEPYN